MKRILALLVTGIWLVRGAEGQEWKQYPYTPEGSVITFPADEGRHPDESTEWWYISGHLTGKETGTPYSFMISYFYFPALGYDGFRILNMARDDTGEFFSDAQGLNYTALGVDSLDIRAILMYGTTESWVYQSDTLGNTIPFAYEIQASATGGGLELSTESMKNPLILGDSGLFNQGSDYTYYYSFTENSIGGSIRYGEISEEVTGTAWIDKQYGSYNPASEERYEWFSVNLSNGMDLVLWDIFTAMNQLPDQSDYRHMSVWEDSVTQFTTHDYQVERLSYAYMPDRAVCYAQSWRLTSQVNQMDLIITTVNSHGDVQLPFRFYEGATSVTGTVEGVPVTGRGFAELLKSYEPPELTIMYPQGGTWKDSLRIGWALLNPDAGYNLLYDLEVSTDQGATYTFIGQGIADKKYTWADPGTLEAGDSCWLRVTAYTPDRTLTGRATGQKASVYVPDSATVFSLNPAAAAPGFTLYPNPASDFLFIDGTTRGSFQYCIFDAMGRMVREGTEDHPGSPAIIPVSELQQGIYLILIKADGKNHQGIPFIKLK